MLLEDRKGRTERRRTTAARSGRERRLRSESPGTWCEEDTEGAAATQGVLVARSPCSSMSDTRDQRHRYGAQRDRDCPLVAEDAPPPRLDWGAARRPRRDRRRGRAHALAVGDDREHSAGPAGGGEAGACVCGAANGPGSARRDR